VPEDLLDHRRLQDRGDDLELAATVWARLGGVGYPLRIRERRFGTEGFSLLFDSVPFTFGQRIDLSLSKTMTAGINIIDAGATGRAGANYGHP
jgi:hypothetical protein